MQMVTVCQPLGGESLYQYLKLGMFINYRKYKTDHISPLVQKTCELNRTFTDL